MLGLGNWVENGKILGCELPSFHPVSTLLPPTFTLFLPCSFLILLNLSLIHLFELFLWNFNFHNVLNLGKVLCSLTPLLLFSYDLE